MGGTTTRTFARLSEDGSLRSRWVRLRAVIVKEFIQVRRDRASLAMSLGIPIILILLFGYAINTDVDHLPTVVWDQSRTPESRELLDGLVNTSYFDIVGIVSGYGEIRSALDGGTAQVAVVVPPDYAARLAEERSAAVQVLIDGSDPQVARAANNTAQLLVQSKAAAIMAERFRSRGIAVDGSLPIEARTRVWYNPDMKSLVFNIPGLIGLIMQNITTMLTAFSLVRERERGTMEQLIVTPVRPLELMLGKLIPYVIIGMISFGFVALAGSKWFGVPVKGSVPLLIELALLFLVTSLSVGLLISTVAKTQLQAMQMTTFFILPSFLLSGFIFPRETMPPFIHMLGDFVPLTYFLMILRGIFLKETGLEHLFPQAVTLAIFATGLFALAMAKFRKRLD